MAASLGFDPTSGGTINPAKLAASGNTVFVQSTSANRMLVAGQRVLMEVGPSDGAGAGAAVPEAASATVIAPAAAPYVVLSGASKGTALRDFVSSCGVEYSRGTYACTLQGMHARNVANLRRYRLCSV